MYLRETKKIYEGEGFFDASKFKQKEAAEDCLQSVAEHLFHDKYSIKYWIWFDLQTLLLHRQLTRKQSM